MAEKRVGRRDPEKEATWVERMKQWERSGLGPRDYCRRHECKETQFHWWKRVLQERGRWPDRREGQGFERNPHDVPPPFTEVHVSAIPPLAGNQEGPRDGKLQLWVGDRYRVSVTDGFEAETLDRVLTVLERRAC